MGFGFDVYFCNTIIEVYVKCGCVVYARKLFDELSRRDLLSWMSMISGHFVREVLVMLLISSGKWW